MLPPIIKKPPHTSLPDVNLKPEWYAEIYLQYPLEEHYVPIHFGDFFRAKSQLSIILNHITTRLCDSENMSGDTLSRLVRDISGELEEWSRFVPPSLSAINIVYPAQMKLQ